MNAGPIETGLQIAATFTVGHPLGMNAMHAGLLAATARRFHADVMVQKGSQIVNGKNTLSVLSLCVYVGDAVTVVASGGDARESIRAITVLFENAFAPPETYIH